MVDVVTSADRHASDGESDREGRLDFPPIGLRAGTRREETHGDKGDQSGAMAWPAGFFSRFKTFFF